MFSPVHHPLLTTRRRMACMLVIAATFAAVFISSVGYSVAWAKDTATPASQPGIVSDAPVFKVMDVGVQPAACLNPGTQQAIKPGGSSAPILFVNINDADGNPTQAHQVVVRTIVQPTRTLQGYCLDVRRAVDNGDEYCQDPNPITVTFPAITATQLVYMFASYPPDLNDRIEQAARQAVVWELTGTGHLDAANPTDQGPDIDAQVLARYNAILADVTANGTSANIPTLTDWSLSIVPASQKSVWPTNPQQAYKIVLTRKGQPAQAMKVALEASKFTLSSPIVTTDINGQGVFTLTANSVGTAVVTGTVIVSVDAPLVFTSNVGATRQPVGATVGVPLNASAQATWQDPTALEVIDEPSAPNRLYMPAIWN